MDNRHMQLMSLKENLEDMDLYLREIEQMLTIMDMHPDSDIKQACEIKLAQMQQYLSNINEAMLFQHFMRSERKPY